MFDVPDRAQDLMHKVDKTYNLWYRIWCDEYIPIIVKRQIWYKEEEILVTLIFSHSIIQLVFEKATSAKFDGSRG